MESVHVLTSHYKDVTPVTKTTIPEFLWNRLDKNPHWKDAICLMCGITGKSYTYENVRNLSKSFGAGLKKKLGLNDLDIVTILLPNCPEYIISLLGILDAGCIAAIMNPDYKISELTWLSKMVDMKCIITIESLLPTVLTLKKDVKNLEHLVILQGNHSESTLFEELSNTDFSHVSFLKGVDIAEERVAVITFSSGTTGLPKGIMLTHHGLCTNMLQQFRASEMFPKDKFLVNGKQGRVLAYLPLFHLSGLCFMALNPFYYGAKIITLPKFQPNSFIHAIQTFRPTTLTVVPPVAYFIVNSSQLSSKDFEETHNVNFGAAPLGTTFIKCLMEKIGLDVNILETFGMTEMSPMTHAMTPPFKHTKFGSVGVLLPNTLAKIVDIQSGQTLGPNCSGELWVKGPQIMKGYFKNEPETKEAVDSEGFLHTGDLFKYDQQGFFYFECRVKEIIQSKGFQVSPPELENILREHPKVSDAAVVGVNIKRSDKEAFPRAFIISKENSLTENDIHEWFNSRVADYKRLTGGIEFVHNIPKSLSGKILRREILQTYNDKQGQMLN